jgi:hypothetical protein
VYDGAKGAAESAASQIQTLTKEPKAHPDDPEGEFVHWSPLMYSVWLRFPCSLTVFVYSGAVDMACVHNNGFTDRYGSVLSPMWSTLDYITGSCVQARPESSHRKRVALEKSPAAKKPDQESPHRHNSLVFDLDSGLATASGTAEELRGAQV